MSSDTARMIAKSARQFEDAAERAAYLERVCHGIARLRAEVERILAEETAEESAAAEAREEETKSEETRGESAGATAGVATREATSAAEVAEPEPESTVEAAGSRIGPYRLVHALGEGGFGTVWLAEQLHPVRRQVALKILKLGMDTAQVVARFEQERQALALMDHPNVARVLDAGATATGRPYFVMDLVLGEPIHEYCDRLRLPVEGRLELFTQVCGAVQHAHMKGIIHRDLKPSNVLVSTREGRPHATVIDFGIAKATSSRLTERSLVTEAYQVIGTLQYMSPEQAQASPDIDTRTDVYSLGVILYELLAGTTPYDAGTMERAVLPEMLRMILESEPRPPSSRLTATRELAQTAAEARGTESRRLVTSLRGELDWIAMKAIEKDRERRYESAEALSADIRRYLAGEAVLAAPPSAGYRMGKFVRRHRGAVAAAGAVAATLVAGVVAFAWQARVAQDERDAALKARESEAEQHRLAEEQRDRALKAEEAAKARAAELALVADFQGGMLEQIDVAEAGSALTADVAARFRETCEKAGLAPEAQQERLRAFQSGWSRVNATDAAAGLIDRTILKPAIATIDAKFGDQPLVDAQLRQALADRYADLGLYAEAEPLQARALEIRTKLLGEDDPLTLASSASSAYLLELQGRFAEAEARYRGVLARRVRLLGDDAKETVDARASLARLLQSRGRAEEAEVILRDVVGWRERHLGERDRTTVTAMVNHGHALKWLRRNDEARAVYSEAFARATAAFGADDRLTADCLTAIAVFAQASGRLLEAERHFRELVAHHRRVYGEDHHWTLVNLGNLGFVLREQGRYEEAHPLLADSYERRRRTLGEDHPTTLWSLHDLGRSFQDRGLLEPSLDCYRRAWEGRRRAYSDVHEFTVESLTSCASTLRALGRPDESAELVRPALERCRTVVGDGRSSARRARAQLARELVETNAAEAEPVFRAVIEECLLDREPDSFEALEATGGVAIAAAVRGDLDGAEKVLRDAIASRKGATAKELLPLTVGLVRVANEAMSRDDAPRAESLAREALRICRAALGDDQERTLLSLSQVGVSLQRQDRQTEAEPLLREAYEGRRRAMGPEHRDTLAALRNFWIVLRDLGRFAEAEPFCREDLQRLLDWPGPLDADRKWGLSAVSSTFHEILAAQGRAVEAVPALRAALARLRKEAGDDDPDTVNAILALGGALQSLSQFEEAEALVREGASRAERLPEGPDSPVAHQARVTLGGILWARSRFDLALPLYEAEEARTRAAHGPAHLSALQSSALVAITLRELGRVPEAADRFQTAMDGAREAGLVADMVDTRYFDPYLDTLRAAGRRDDLIRALVEGTEIERLRNPEPGLARAGATLRYIGRFADAGAWAEAETYLREAIALREAAAPDLWSLFNARAVLGETLFRRGRFAEAEALVVGGYEGVLARRSQMPPQAESWVKRGAERILEFYAAWDAAEPGKGHDAKLAEWKSKLGAPAAAPAPARK